eukprot:9492566-Pyramimonas_sp.AAC.1
MLENAAKLEAPGFRSDPPIEAALCYCPACMKIVAGAMFPGLVSVVRQSTGCPARYYPGRLAPDGEI